MTWEDATEGPLDDYYTLDQGREATAVEDSSTAIDGAESLLNELSGVFDDLGPPTPPKPPATVQSDEPPVEPVVTPEEVPVASPPRIEPSAIIWKPERRLFRLRRR